MKTASLTIIVLMTQLIAFGQVLQKNIEPEKMNILYLCVKNPLKIKNLDKTDSLSISDGKVIKDNKGNYFALVEHSGIVTISLKDKKGNTNNFEFRAKRLPEPKFVIFNKNMAFKSVKKEEVKDIPLSCRLENFDFDVKYTILSYKMTMIPKVGEKKEIIINGSSLNSKEAIDFISNSQPNDIIVFDNVITKNDCGDTSTAFNLIVIEIK
jgi:hypothetical protein